MPRPKPIPRNAAADTPVKPAESSPKPLARPKILNGRAMPPSVLPKGFDLTVHQKIHASGNVKPVTRAELAARIKLLEQRKSTIG